MNRNRFHLAGALGALLAVLTAPVHAQYPQVQNYDIANGAVTANKLANSAAPASNGWAYFWPGYFAALPSATVYSAASPITISSAYAIGINTFGAAGSGHAPGAVPDPGATLHSPAWLLGDDGAFHAPTTNTGTVTSFSASVPGGLTATVTNPTTTPALAITTTLSGIVKGTGSGFAAATAGTDYLAGVAAGTGISVSSSGGTSTISNAGVTSFNGAAGAATGVAYRRCTLTFFQPSTAGLDGTQRLTLPPGTNEASLTWTVKAFRFYTGTPSASATTIQPLYGASGNAAFGSGTAFTSGSYSNSGTAAYLTTGSSFTTTSFSSGTPFEINWSAIGGANSSVEIDFEAASAG